MKVPKGLRFGLLLNQMTRNTKSHAKNRSQQHVSGNFVKQKIYHSHTTKSTDWGTVHRPAARSIKEKRLGEQQAKLFYQVGPNLLAANSGSFVLSKTQGKEEGGQNMT